MEARLPLVVIVGPTASGKTALAIKLARRFNGEIICADSRTVYKGLDIGTAKPTAEERALVPHWGLDLVEPGERFTAADFQSYATRKIDEIRSRHHVPFIVGGTGLYVDSILFKYQFGNQVDEAQHGRYEYMDLPALRDYCIEHNIEIPENSKNKRRLIRAIEQGGVNRRRELYPVENSYIVGISTDREVLKERIRNRAEHIFDNSVVEEATIVGKKYGWDNEAMTGNIYPLLKLYLENVITLAEAIDIFTTKDWRLAKRQLTWFKRNPYIKWYTLTEAERYISRLLAEPHS